MKQFLIGVAVVVVGGLALTVVQTNGKGFLSVFSRQAFVLDPLYFWSVLVLASIGIYAILRGLVSLIRKGVPKSPKKKTARDLYFQDVYEGMIVTFGWGRGFPTINPQSFRYLCPKDGMELEKATESWMVTRRCGKCNTKYFERDYRNLSESLTLDVRMEFERRIRHNDEWKGAEKRLRELQEK